MAKKMIFMTLVSLGILVAAGIFVSRMLNTASVLPPPGASEPEPPNPMNQVALELSASQRLISDTLAAASGSEVSDEQFSAFAAALRQVYASPLREATRAELLKYSRTLPLFLASEEALFRCMRGVKRDPKACEPSPEYLDLLHEGVASGNLSKEEADKYMDVLKSMKDPAKRPVLPDGGVDFMEKESAMRARNFRRIVAVFNKIDTMKP